MKQKNKIELAIEEEDQKPMMVHCSRCDKLFDRKTKYTKICEDCWMNTKKGPTAGFRGMDSCELCGDIIYKEQKRINLVCQDGVFGLKWIKRKSNTTATYHYSCWENLIQSRITSIVKKNKLLTLRNRSSVSEQMLA